MKHTVRSFSVGLLAAGLIMLVVYLFLDESMKAEQDYNKDEVIAHVEQEGYRVITEEEYISMSVAKTQQDNLEKNKVEPNKEEESSIEEEDTSNVVEEENSSEEQQEETVEEKEEDNTPALKTITIEPGMATSQISSMLANQNLIDDAQEFNSYLQEHEYSLRVQMGDHELKEGMSFYEIAEALTN